MGASLDDKHTWGRNNFSEPKGHRKRGKNPRIEITFDEDTFAQIKERAKRLNLSFAQCVRELVDFGLIDAEEIDA